MDWICSILALLTLWFMGNKSKIGPPCGLITECFWFYYALTINQYGLLLAVFGFAAIHLRNAFKWGSFKRER